MIKITKQLLLNPASIWISGVKCSVSNIVKVSSILDWEWILLTLTSLPKESILPEFFSDHGLKYHIEQLSDNIEIHTVIPYSLLEKVLEKAISEDPEDIVMVGMHGAPRVKMPQRPSYEELVTSGVIAAYISVSMDENAMLICANKSLMQTRNLYKNIKTIRLD